MHHDPILTHTTLTTAAALPTGWPAILNSQLSQKYDQVMIQVNIHEMKAKLSEYLAAALRGERVVIARRNLPLAELTPIRRARTEPRPLGQGPREEGYEVPDVFWEPLPEELVAAFNGTPDGMIGGQTDNGRSGSVAVNDDSTPRT